MMAEQDCLIPGFGEIMLMRIALCIVLLFVSLQAQTINPIGYELGIFKTPSDNVPAYSTTIDLGASSCISVSSAGDTTVPVQINPTTAVWNNDTQTQQCSADLSAFLKSLPQSDQAYYGRLRSYGISATDPTQRVYNAWSDWSNPFYAPFPLSLSCPANIKTTTPTVAYQLSTVGGVAPVSSTCTPPSGSTFNPGTTTVACAVKDAIARSAVCSFTVNYSALISDTTDPAVSNLIVRQSGNSQNYNATVRATDNVRVTRVEFLVDGLIQSYLSTSTSTTWSATLRITTRGNHLISVNAYDAAGNHASIGIEVKR